MKAIAAILVVLILATASLSAGALDAPEKGFSDVSPDSPEGRAVMHLTAQGAIDGYPDGAFYPDAPISAVDYVRMISSVRGITGTDDALMQLALSAGWYDWDELPPTEPARYQEPLQRELAANILVKAFFGQVSYDWNVTSGITDFQSIGGRYYTGVLGGIALGVIPHVPGTPFYPDQDLSRGAACLWVYNAMNKTDLPSQPSSQAPTPSPAPVTAASGGVKQNGWLSVIGTQLCNEKGESVVLHGMSSMGIQWYPQYTNFTCIENTVERGANVFRIAMYTEEGGYLSDKARYAALVEQIVENAVQADVYVIIDWHILSDGNPMTHLSEALVFFSDMSSRYADTPNVIYEICNEPNGNVTWSADVKPYAEQVTAAIRKNSNGIILIGNPMWDQDVVTAASDPVAGSNLMYTLHFYAGTHHQELRDKGSQAIRMGAPIFVSEWGTSAADGSGGVFLDSSDQWLSWMDENKLSWCNWSLCDKNETSAALVPGCPSNTAWTEADLTESGRYVFSRFGQADPQPASAERVTVSESAQLFGEDPGREVRVFRDGTLLSAEDYVSTGCRIESVLSPTGRVERSADIVIYGDVTGSGTVGLTQLVRMAQALTGAKPLHGLYLTAGQFGTPGPGITLTDLVKCSALVANGGKLTVEFVNEETFPD